MKKTFTIMMAAMLMAAGAMAVEQAPRKANLTVDDLAGIYTAVSSVDEYDYYQFKAEVQATDVEGEVLLTGL